MDLLHVDDVGAAVEAGITAGRPYRIRVTHFAEQISEARHRTSDRSGRKVVAVAACAGDTSAVAASAANCKNLKTNFTGYPALPGRRCYLLRPHKCLRRRFQCARNRRSAQHNLRLLLNYRDYPRQATRQRSL